MIVMAVGAKILNWVRDLIVYLMIDAILVYQQYLLYLAGLM